MTEKEQRAMKNFELQHEKMYSLTCAFNEDSNQPAHPFLHEEILHPKQYKMHPLRILIRLQMHRVI